MRRRRFKRVPGVDAQKSQPAQGCAVQGARPAARRAEGEAVGRAAAVSPAGPGLRQPGAPATRPGGWARLKGPGAQRPFAGNPLNSGKGLQHPCSPQAARDLPVP